MADPRTVAAIAAAGIRALVGARDGEPVPPPVCKDVGHISNPTGAGCVYCGGPVAAEMEGAQ